MRRYKQTTTIICSMAALGVLAAFPFVLPIYWTLILTEILIMGLFAMSFNLLLGYTGLLSFGQAGFFGVGAYATALLISSGGNSLLLCIGISLVSAAAAAAVIGFLCVRRDEIYFAMITLGFGMMLFTLAHNWIGLTGGSDGLPLMTVPSVRMFGIELSLFNPTNMYLFVLSVITVCTFFLWRLVRSPFGLMLTAIRENKQRLSFVGAGVQNLRLAAFVIAGALAGVSGGLFSLFNAMATPDFMHWGFSARPVLMTILGGSTIFFGPMLGAAVFFALEQIITNITENWMIFLGLILTPVVIFFPRGILGTLIYHLTKGRKQNHE